MFANYLKIAIRNISRHKGYAFINILGLSLGIACCFMIILYVQDELGYDQFHVNADRIYRVAADRTNDTGTSHYARTAPLLAPTLVQDLPEIEHAVRFKTYSGLYAYGDRQFYESNGVLFTDPEVFDVFTFPLLVGNPQTALREPFSVVMTEAMAQKYFGAENPLGKVITLQDSLEITVTGVLASIPHDSHLQFDMLGSFSTLEQIWGTDSINTWQNNIYYTYILLRKTADISAIETQLPDFITRHISTSISPGSQLHLPLERLTDIHLRSDRLHDLHTGGDAASVYLFSAIALFILIVACINFMNLATARSAGRAREVGLRKVVGAYRSQLINQFIGESLVISTIALVVGLGIVQLSLSTFNDISGKMLNMDALFTLENIVLLAGITLVVGILSGSYPALFLSAFQPVVVLKGRLKVNAGGGILRQCLVVFQFAISIALIAGTNIATDQLQLLRTQDLGFDKEQLVVIPFYWEGEVQSRYELYKTELLKRQDVLGVTASGDVPGRMFTALTFNTTSDQGPQKGGITSLLVDPDFVKTYQAEVIAGRDLSADFSMDASGTSFLLNETAIRTLGWMNPEDAVGQSFKLQSKTGQIVGVVKDFNFSSLQETVAPLAMGVWPSWFGYISIRVQSNDMPSTIASLEDVWRNIVPNRPFDYFFLNEELNRQYQSEARLSTVFASFSTMAIVIACLGLLGLISFTAERRTKEIGIRKVLGASAITIIRMLSWDFIKLVLIANLIAVPVTYYVMSEWLNSFAYHANIGVTTFLFAGLLALAIAFVTISFQAIKAACLNPVDSLQYE